MSGIPIDLRLEWQRQSDWYTNMASRSRASPPTARQRWQARERPTIISPVREPVAMRKAAPRHLFVQPHSGKNSKQRTTGLRIVLLSAVPLARIPNRSVRRRQRLNFQIPVGYDWMEAVVRLLSTFENDASVFQTMEHSVFVAA